MGCHDSLHARTPPLSFACFTPVCATPTLRPRGSSGPSQLTVHAKGPPDADTRGGDLSNSLVGAAAAPSPRFPPSSSASQASTRLATHNTHQDFLSVQAIAPKARKQGRKWDLFSADYRPSAICTAVSPPTSGGAGAIWRRRRELRAAFPYRRNPAPPSALISCTWLLPICPALRREGLPTPRRHRSAFLLWEIRPTGGGGFLCRRLAESIRTAENGNSKWAFLLKIILLERACTTLSHALDLCNHLAECMIADYLVIY